MKKKQKNCWDIFAEECLALVFGSKLELCLFINKQIECCLSEVLTETPERQNYTVWKMAIFTSLINKWFLNTITAVQTYDHTHIHNNIIVNYITTMLLAIYQKWKADCLCQIFSKLFCSACIQHQIIKFPSLGLIFHTRASGRDSTFSKMPVIIYSTCSFLLWNKIFWEMS